MQHIELRVSQCYSIYSSNEYIVCLQSRQINYLNFHVESCDDSASKFVLVYLLLISSFVLWPKLLPNLSCHSCIHSKSAEFLAVKSTGSVRTP
jgi:hypothetical protein